LAVDEAEEGLEVVAVESEDEAFVDELAGSDVDESVADDDWVSLCEERCAVELAGVDFGRSWLEGIEGLGRFKSGFTAGSFFGSYSLTKSVKSSNFPSVSPSLSKFPAFAMFPTSLAASPTQFKAALAVSNPVLITFPAPLNTSLMIGMPLLSRRISSRFFLPQGCGTPGRLFTKPPTCDDRPAAMLPIWTAFAAGLGPRIRLRNGVRAAKAPPTPAESSTNGIGIGAATRSVEVVDAVTVTVPGVGGSVTSEVTVAGSVFSDPR
jgi:hypothetical protein